MGKDSRLSFPQAGRLDHIAVEVEDLDEAASFYERVLCLERLPIPEEVQAEGVLWYDLGEGRALHLVSCDGIEPAHKAHFALAVDDLEAWRSHVARFGIEMTAPGVRVYNAERFFLRDPSGNRVEIVRWLE